MFSNKAAPPSYARDAQDVSLTSDVNKLVDTSLAVESSLASVKDAVKVVDALLASDLENSASACQDKYFKVLTISRRSAIGLRGAIDSFTLDLIPLAKLPESEAPLADLLDAVQSEADKIANLANQDASAVDKAFGFVKKDLQELGSSLEKALNTLRADADAPLKMIKDAIKSLDVNRKAQRSTTTLLKELVGGKSDDKKGRSGKTSGPASVSVVVDAGKNNKLPTSSKLEFVDTVIKKWAILEKFFKQEAEIAAAEGEYEKKVDQLRQLEKDVDNKVKKIQASIEETQSVSKVLEQLDGKLGHFEGIWDKLLKDSSDLSKYLKDSGSKGTGLTRETLIKRINDEGKAYTQIKNALEVYVLKVNSHTD